MDESVRQRAIRLLEEADSRLSSLTYEDLPARYQRRLQTIRNKTVDLKEDIRDERT
jgi:hypothetical protein